VYYNLEALRHRAKPPPGGSEPLHLARQADAGSPQLKRAVVVDRDNRRVHRPPALGVDQGRRRWTRGERTGVFLGLVLFSFLRKLSVLQGRCDEEKIVSKDDTILDAYHQPQAKNRDRQLLQALTLLPS
jgi:hypothetical protein